MRWLAGLSPAKAIKLALVWPAFLFAVATIFLGGFVFQSRAGWTVGYTVAYDGSAPGWLVATVATFLVVIGPSAVFLVVWRFARGRVHAAAS